MWGVLVLLFILVVLVSLVVVLRGKKITGGTVINRTKNLSPPILFQMIKILIQKPKRALSFGTGGGVAERNLIRKGWHVTCVDIDEDVDVLMRERLTATELKNYVFVKSKVTDFVPDGTYDLIFANNVLPFGDKHNTLDMLSSIHKLLNPQGVFAFTLFGYGTDLVKSGKAFGHSGELDINLTEVYTEQTSRKQSNGMFEVLRYIYKKSE
jgi:SAM-dependent methyltransferase